MTIKQSLAEFFKENPDLSKESKSLYNEYKIKNYTYNQSQNQHNLTVIARKPNAKNQNNYQLERIGDLHPDLVKCLQEKEEIVYFWTGNKLKASDSFYFVGGGYYWTIFPKKDFMEEQAAQEYLDNNYPKEGRDKITKLSIAGIKTGGIGWKLLKGHLDLSDFVNLKELDSDNQLTNLDINNCPQIEKLYCSNNQLTNADTLLSSLNPEKLKELDLSNNNFPQTSSNLFSKFINLESLLISSNNFYGSLEPLQNLTKLENLDISYTNLNSGTEYLPNSLEKISYFTWGSNCKVLEVKDQLDSKYWRDIHKDFIDNTKILKKEWVELFGFNKEQTKQCLREWNIRPRDAKFLHWYLNTKKLDLEWALANEEEFKHWRDNYQYFGTCEECQQTNTSIKWCQSCNAKHFQKDFNKWTSSNPNIDKFIQQCQLEATSPWNVLEWIPYEKLSNIEHLAEGGFGKVCKAEWSEGHIEKWNNKKKKWKRKRDILEKIFPLHNFNYENHKTVALKTLSNSQNLSNEFLQELTLYKRFKSEVSQMVPCYGVSQDPEGNYILVMEYMEEGNLREYLRKNYRELNLEKKFRFLKEISQGLKNIHQQNLVHRDFHSGNIIVNHNRGNEIIECKITDLGLCQPVGETDNNQVYGVLPYVAPEVLRNKTYTPAADIYSLGMIMYELLTDLPPFQEFAHDNLLGLRICQGIRSQFPKQIKYPQLLVDLIKRCWDGELNNRPTAREISGIVNDWFEEEHGRLEIRKDTPFYQQCKEAEEYNKTLPEEVKFPNYQSPEKTWHSKPINTKQITQLLQQKNEEYHTKTLEELTLDKLNLEDKPEAKVEIPPKN